MKMRLALGLATLLSLFQATQAVAAEGCLVAGSAYSSGSAYCQPALRDGQIQQVLFTCENGAWSNTNQVCPEKSAYFCQVGAYPVSVGQRLLLGAGPAFLECKFPGILSLNQETPTPIIAGTPSVLVHSVQLFLSDEGEGLNCEVDKCDGQADEKTLAAVAAFVRKNFASLTAEEQAAFGVTDATKVEETILAQSPIDIMPLFAGTFDVPVSR